MGNKKFCKEKQLAARISLTGKIIEWSRGKDSILLELPTGTGKNYNSFSLLEEWNFDQPRILVVVPEIPLIDNYKKDAEDLGFGYLVRFMEVICYASLKNYQNSEWDVVILDEFHHVSSDKRLDYISSIKYERLIGLTATLSLDIRLKIQEVIKFQTFKLSVDDAINTGILPKPSIYILEFNLDDVKEEFEFKIGKSTIKCTARGYYNRMSENISYWSNRYQDKREVFAKNKMLQLGGQRQRFIANQKNHLVQKVLNRVEGKGSILVMCGSIDQAKKLGGKEVCSSRNTPQKNKEIIEKFNQGGIKRLFAKDMLKEGMNLRNCKYGLIIQLGNKDKDYIQMLGRLLRDNEPVQYIIHAVNTVDDRFISNSLQSINEDWIKRLKV